MLELDPTRKIGRQVKTYQEAAYYSIASRLYNDHVTFYFPDKSQKSIKREMIK